MSEKYLSVMLNVVKHPSMTAPTLEPTLRERSANVPLCSTQDDNCDFSDILLDSRLAETFSPDAIAPGLLVIDNVIAGVPRFNVA